MAQRACSKFMRADFKTADSCFSACIRQDSLVFGYYYLRGTNRLYARDTLAAVSDFAHAVKLRKMYGDKSIEDTLVSIFVLVRPHITTPLCTPSVWELGSTLLMIRLGAWQYLVVGNKKAACKTLKQVRKEGVSQAEPLRRAIGN